MWNPRLFSPLSLHLQRLEKKAELLPAWHLSHTISRQIQIISSTCICRSENRPHATSALQLTHKIFLLDSIIHTTIEEFILTHCIFRILYNNTQLNMVCCCKYSITDSTQGIKDCGSSSSRFTHKHSPQWCKTNKMWLSGTALMENWGGLYRNKQKAFWSQFQWKLLCSVFGPLGQL